MQYQNALNALGLVVFLMLGSPQTRADITTPPRAADAKVVYGTDDRVDVYQETDPDHLAWAASTCAVISTSRIVSNEPDGFNIATSAYLRSGKPACPTEPFGDQPVAANCTGFLVGEDLIATAGHCINAGDINNWQFVFGYVMQDATTPVVTVPADQVYSAVEIVGRMLESAGADYSIVRLDRPVTAPGAVPLPIRRSGVIANGTAVGVIGHPSGLPMKIAFGPTTAVRSNSAATHFVANLDTYGGNSGSPVFNAATGVVEGILVRGESDFIIGTDCFTSNVVSDTGGRGEDVTKTTIFADLIPPLLSAVGSVTFDRAVYTCNAMAAITVKDADLAGQPSVNITLTRNAAAPAPLTLPALPGGDGSFQLSISLAAFGATDGDQFTVHYTDAHGEGGTPAEASDAALLDCVGPTMSAVTVGPVYSTLAVVSFTTSEAATDRVEYGETCEDRALTASSGNSGTTHIIGVTGLRPETTYHLAPVAIDDLGNETVYLDGDHCFVITTPPSVDRLTERFTNGHDLAFSRLTFTPDDSLAFYSACVEPVEDLSANPAGGTVLNLGDDEFGTAVLDGGAVVSLFGVAYNHFYVSANGVITFEAGDISHQETLSTHFSSPRISLWHDDFLPSASSTISWKQFANRVAVTYENIAEINTTNSNTMQAELFFDGRIRLTYLRMDTRDGIVGLSGTDTYPLDFVASDLSAYPACPAGEGEEEDPIYFADAALETAVRAALGVPVAPVYPSDMVNLVVLNAAELGIVHLEGLQYAVNLTSLDLSGNAIQSLGPLQPLQSLATLQLANNAMEITSLDPLVQNPGLAAADTLDLYCCPLAQAALDGLVTLNARGVQISFYYGPGCSGYVGEGEGEGEGEAGFSSADTDLNGDISLSELLRIIQFYNFAAHHCNPGVADGFAPGVGAEDCAPHTTDYNPQDWRISLTELLRMIQFYNEAGYTACGEGEDGFCVVH